jgi:hypothetical protein
LNEFMNSVLFCVFTGGYDLPRFMCVVIFATDS